LATGALALVVHALAPATFAAEDRAALTVSVLVVPSCRVQTPPDGSEPGSEVRLSCSRQVTNVAVTADASGGAASQSMRRVLARPPSSVPISRTSTERDGRALRVTVDF
jgi:hypothetical protein